MKLIQVFVLVWIFVEVAFLFPILYDTCQNVDASLSLAPVIKMFPYIFIVIFAIVPIYFGFKER